MRLSRLNIEHQQQVFKALKDGKIGPKREFEFMVDKLWAAEHQEVLFELPPEQSGQALKRIDEAIDRMLNFTRAMFRRDDARVLESLIGLDGLGPRIEKISAIMTELARVRTALQHAKAGNVAVQAGLLDSVGGAPARRR
jgi:hypothetical protein